MTKYIGFSSIIGIIIVVFIFFPDSVEQVDGDGTYIPPHKYEELFQEKEQLQKKYEHLLEEKDILLTDHNQLQTMLLEYEDNHEISLNSRDISQAISVVNAFLTVDSPVSAISHFVTNTDVNEKTIVFPNNRHVEWIPTQNERILNFQTIEEGKYDAVADQIMLTFHIELTDDGINKNANFYLEKESSGEKIAEIVW